MSKLKTHIREMSKYNNNYYLLDNIFMNCTIAHEECNEEYNRITYTLGNIVDGIFVGEDIYFELTNGEFEKYYDNDYLVDFKNHTIYDSYPC